MSQKLSKFVDEWQFDRGLTLDLLRWLSEEELRWSPGAGVGELWKQFRHIGRVQENYIEAITSGAVRFTPRGTYEGTSDGAELVAYLERLDGTLRTVLSSVDDSVTVDWFGQENLPVFDHCRRMLSHETLHHGQLIVYMRLMNKKFPASWHIWGF